MVYVLQGNKTSGVEKKNNPLELSFLHNKNHVHWISFLQGNI